MAPPRRMGPEDSKVRTRFIDAAEEILRDEGYPAISARQVAARAGLKTQLLYYYFRTMDDLLLALVRRINERRQERFEEALAAREPLRALWDMNNDPSGAALAAELTSIAGHRDAVRTEIVRSAQQFRVQQIEAVSGLLSAGKSGEADYPAAGIVMIAVALSRALVTEGALGLTEGHREAQQIVERLLHDFSAADRARD